MKSKNIIQFGGLFFLIGFILITISWYFTYPVHISPINDLTFFQFYPSLWPGLIFCLIGLFLVGYFSKNKIIQVICCCLSPLLLYITPFFYSYLSSSDSGAARSMFLVFQNVGIQQKIVPYFEFPNYFVLNQILHQTLGINEKGVAVISLILYGVLLALFLYLIFSKLLGKNNNQVSFLLVIIYFIGMYGFFNYQWVPQTLALVYFVLLVFVSTYLFSERLSTEWEVLVVLIFLPLNFTHAFIPTIFLLFFGLLALKKRYLLPLFLFLISIYIVSTLYYTLTHFEIYKETFRQSIQGFGGEYAATISKSFGESETAMSQFISIVNRFRVPLIWAIASLGTLLLFYKRKIGFLLIALCVAGGIYLAAGTFYSMLGGRMFQILLIPLLFGFTFFIFKWKKLTLFVIIIILILAVFGPMRDAYDNTQFQTDEEASVCNFLADNIPVFLANNSAEILLPRMAVNQVDYGYLLYMYLFSKYPESKNLPNGKNIFPTIQRPGESDFFQIFNKSLNKRDYVIYNSNVGKEILNLGKTKDQLHILLSDLMVYNNKINDCGKTFIINGVSSQK